MTVSAMEECKAERCEEKGGCNLNQGGERPHHPVTFEQKPEGGEGAVGRPGEEGSGQEQPVVALRQERTGAGLEEGGEEGGDEARS